jgi:hypothetical protein
MSMERLDYLDRAFKSMGLTLGHPEANEISRREGQLGLNERWEALELADLHRRPLSGIDAHILLAMAEMTVTKLFGVRPPSVSNQFIDIPGLGTTGVRIVLPNPTLGNFLRMEGSDLHEAASYLVCEVNPTQPGKVRLVGWAGRQDVLRSPKVRLADDEPEVYVVDISDDIPKVTDVSEEDDPLDDEDEEKDGNG